MSVFERFRNTVSGMLKPKSMEGVVTKQQGSRLLEEVLLSPDRATTPSFGTTELLRSYSTMPWLRAVTHKVGQAVGTTQWKLFVERDSNGNVRRAASLQRARTKAQFDATFVKQSTIFDLEEVEDHPLLDLLHHGNDQLPGQTVFQMTQTHLDLVGEGFWLLERNGLGMPVALWPIPPNWVMDMPTVDKPFWSLRLHNKQVEVPITEMLRFIEADPSAPYGRGSGIARSLSDELETDEYASKHLKTYFYNNARPDIIVSADHLSPTDTARMEEKWLEKQQGFWNRYKPFFMSRKVDIQQLSQSFESMQLTELRKQERDTVMQVYGVSPEKFGVLTASNRSTITAADLFWTKDVLMPRIEHLRNTMQDRLVPMFDDNLILDFQSPVVDDAQLNLEVMGKMPGAFTKNEWRGMAQFPSLGEDGEVFLVNPGVVEVPLGESIPEATPEPSGDGEEEALTIDIISKIDTQGISDTVMQRLQELMRR